MKIKPLYIYLGAFVIIIIALIFMTSGGQTTESMPNTSNESSMPDDDIHKNLGNGPGSGNVSSEFRQKMERLKSNYEANPGDTSNAKEYARLLAAAHEPEEAVKVYKSILDDYAKRNDIRLELATVYYNLKQFENAKREIETVFKNDPDSPDVQYNLGAVEAALGNNERAKTIWRQVINDYPGSEAARIASTSLQSLQ